MKRAVFRGKHYKANGGRSMEKHKAILMKAFLALVLCVMLAFSAALAERPTPPLLDVGLHAEIQPTSKEISCQEAVERAREHLFNSYSLEGALVPGDYRIDGTLYDYLDAPGHPFWFMEIYPQADTTDDAPVFFIEIDAHTGAVEYSRYIREDEYDLIGDPALYEKDFIHFMRDMRFRGAELVWGEWSFWSLEQQASFDAWAREILYYGKDVVYYALLPGLEDVPLEDAHRIAKQAIIDKYGWDEARFDLYEVCPSFSMVEESDQTCRWAIYFRPKSGTAVENDDTYYVWIFSPSGHVVEVRANSDGNG